MIVKQTSIVINRPVEQVFAAMADVKRQPLWDPGVSNVRLTPDGPVNVGTKITETRTFMGRTSENTGEVIEFEPNARIIRKSSADHPMKLLGSLNFVPAPQGTEVVWRWDLQFSGVTALLGPMIANAMIKGADQSLRGLKDRLESGAAVGWKEGYGDE